MSDRAAYHIEEARAWIEGVRSVTNPASDPDDAVLADPLHAIAHALVAIALTLSALAAPGPQT